jgi:hypothetical protein
MNERDRQEIEMLLPWHATGKLSADEKRRVDAALAADAGLRRQVKLIEAELTQTVAGNEAAALPRSLDADTLMARLANEPKSVAVQASGWLGRLKEAFSGPARVPLRWATVAAALLLVLQGGTITTLLIQRDSGGYHTAGGPNGALAPGTYALVRLNDAASIGEVGEALQQMSISIVDGPKAGGLYTLRLGNADMPATERDARINDLRTLSKLIVFAAPLK